MKGLVLALVLAFVLLCAGAFGATADTSPSDAQQQQALIDQIRAQLGSNLADALAAQQQLRNSLLENAAQQQTVQAKIAEVQKKIADLEVEIADAQRREAALAQRIAAERKQLRELAHAIYVAPTSVLVVLGQAQSLSDLLTRIADLNVAGARATELKGSLALDLNQVQAEREKEQAARDEQVKLREELDGQLSQLKALMQAVWTQVQLWSQSNNVGQIPTSAGHSTRYRFIWPEPQAHISQAFGPSSFWFEPPYGGYPHFHTGIDLVEPFGSPVYAADDGVVALVGSSSSGYGNFVVIAHSGGLDTLYGHLSVAVVKLGDRVIQGQPVGLEGSTGNSTGAHLHFELRINQKPVDPTPYLPPGAPSSFKG